MLRTYRDQAIVLRSYKLGEADRIVILLGKESGQIRAVAKGIRKPTSRFGGRLDAFNLVDLQLHRGRNLDTVTQVELLSGYARPLGENYEAFTAAKVMVETVQKLTESAPEPAYYPLLHGALGALVAGRIPPDLITASFLFRLMRLAGWDPALHSCAGCGHPGPHRLFSAEVGGFVCSSCAPPGSTEAPPAELIQALLDGDWERAGQTGPRQGEQVRNLAGWWTQYHLEQRLRSFPFLQKESDEYS